MAEEARRGRCCPQRAGLADGESVPGYQSAWVDGRRGKVVDTVLAKLHVSAGKLPDLNGLIDQPNSILLSEIEPVLVKSRHIGVLTKLYRHHGDDTKLLDAWAKLVDGEWTDADVQDPLTRIFDLLSEKKDRVLIQKWVPWLIKKDSERALKVRRLFITGCQ